VLCFNTERTNLFNNRRIGSCWFKELKTVIKKDTPRKAHKLNPGTHGVTSASVRVTCKKTAFHACHSRLLYRYLLNSYYTQNQRKETPHTHPNI